jgi:isopenicillin N synthase-like dioxygenase
MSIPIIDFAQISANSKLEKTDATEDVSRKLHEALSTIGFAYIKNHGIDKVVIDRAFQASKSFFALPKDVKQVFTRRDFYSNHGWDALEAETLDPDRPADFKEGYYVMPQHAKTWPDQFIPDFRRDSTALFEACTDLAKRVLFAIAIGLKLSDSSFFVQRHNILEKQSSVCMRYQYYPPLTNVTLKTDQVRCGEHTDYGSITILFQDDVGGLEVRTRDGQYVQATPVPDTVLINIADLMQRWTGDKLVSTRHRILLPDDPVKWAKSRLSVAFFVDPDSDCVIETVDSSGVQYPPITCKEYMKSRYAATYLDQPL